MTEFKFLHHDAAFRFVRTFFVSQPEYGVVSPIVPLHKGRHAMVHTDKGGFYLLFKKEFFWKFPEFYEKFFVAYPNLNGAGESINVSCLAYAKSRSLKLLFVYPNGAIYVIDPDEVYRVNELCKSFYPNGFVRSQDRLNEYKVAYSNGLTEDVNEATISFPVKLFARFK